MKGNLVRWDDSKGFGFIGLKDNTQNIFIHISALKKMQRRPVVGDEISFEIYTDNTGKKRATNAQIIGVKKKSQTQKTKNEESAFKPLSTIAFFSLMVFIAYGVFTNYFNNHDSPSLANKQDPSVPTSFSRSNSKRIVSSNSYSCENNKFHCSQMTSCKEAIFYIKNCPNTKMDGDADGIPCERQWCH